MKKQRVALTIIMLLFLGDIVLLVRNREIHSKIDGHNFTTAIEQKTSIQEVSKSVRKILSEFPEEAENVMTLAERRRIRRNILEERIYTLMALEALRMRIVKEAKKMALQGRNVCGPYLERINSRNNILLDMVQDERNKMASRIVELNTPRFRAGMAEHKERMLQKRERVYSFIHNLDVSRFDEATAKAHADYLVALDEFRILYNDPAVSYNVKLAAQSKADSLAQNFGSLFKSNYLDQGFNQEKQKNELFVSALYDFLCRIRFQSEINREQ